MAPQAVDPTAPEPGSPFEQQLAREILRSERLRAKSLALLFCISPLLFYGIVQFASRGNAQALLSEATIQRMVMLEVGIAAYELAQVRLIDRYLRSGRLLPKAFGYLNAFVEASFPTLAVIIMAQEVRAVFAPLTPASLGYFLFIILSTLRLDAGIARFTGVVAAIEYLAVSLYYIQGEATPGLGPELRVPTVFVARSLVLLFAGLLAGFVARQIQQRVTASFRAIRERDRVVDLFGQQVSPEVAELLVQEGALDSRRRRVCVMFLDLRGFTPFSEARPPEAVVAYLNALFSILIDEVGRHHGIINQFLGDGFMATFGAPLSHENDCRDAIDAAREILRRVERAVEAGELPPTRLGIGLHTGEAVTGNLGTQRRQQYSITGPVVILASRIEQLNKEYSSQILASEEVLEAAGHPVSPLRDLGEVRVKGWERPLRLFQIA